MIAGGRVLEPDRLNVVCFAVDGFTPDQIADAVTAGGETFLTSTLLDGMPALRAAFSNWRTTSADVDRVYRAIANAVA